MDLVFVSPGWAKRFSLSVLHLMVMVMFLEVVAQDCSYYHHQTHFNNNALHRGLNVVRQHRVYWRSVGISVGSRNMLFSVFLCLWPGHSRIASGLQAYT